MAKKIGDNSGKEKRRKKGRKMGVGKSKFETDRGMYIVGAGPKRKLGGKNKPIGGGMGGTKTLLLWDGPKQKKGEL